MSGCPWVAVSADCKSKQANTVLLALTWTLAWMRPSQPIGGLCMAKVGPERTNPLGKHPYQVLSYFCLLIISTEQPPQPCAHPRHFPKPGRAGTGAPGSSAWCRAHLSTPRRCCWRCCCLTPCCSLQPPRLPAPLPSSMAGGGARAEAAPRTRMLQAARSPPPLDLEQASYFVLTPCNVESCTFQVAGNP